MSDWRMAIQMAAAESAQRIAALEAENARLQGELEQARLKHEQDQAAISLLERNWYTCTEERDNVRQQLVEARDVASRLIYDSIENDGTFVSVKVRLLNELTRLIGGK